jgi:hypothetical protein
MRIHTYVALATLHQRAQADTCQPSGGGSAAMSPMVTLRKTSRRTTTHSRTTQAENRGRALVATPITSSKTTYRCANPETTPVQKRAALGLAMSPRWLIRRTRLRELICTPVSLPRPVEFMLINVACTELGAYQQAQPVGTPSLLSRLIKPDYTQRWCDWAFPAGEYNSIPSGGPDLSYYNKYGDLNITAMNLALIDGSGYAPVLIGYLLTM